MNTRTFAIPTKPSRAVAVPADSSWSGCTTPGKFTVNSGTTPRAGTAKETAAVAIVSHTRMCQRDDSGRPVGNSWMIRKNTSESPIDAWKNQAAQAAPPRPCWIAAYAYACTELPSGIWRPTNANNGPSTPPARRRIRSDPTTAHATDRSSQMNVSVTDLAAHAFNAPDANRSETDTIGTAIATMRLIGPAPRPGPVPGRSCHGPATTRSRRRLRRDR